MDFSLQKEVEIYRMNNCSFWKMESEMQKTEIQKNENTKKRSAKLIKR